MGPVAGPETGVLVARAQALAVLRIRSAALAVALLPAAVAVVLLAGVSMGRIPDGGGWSTARWAVTGAALLALALAAAVTAVVVRARPAQSPTVPIPEETAPDLYRLVRELAERLGVPAPSAMALTPDCDSWLEDRTHPAHGPPRRPRAGLAGLPRPQRRSGAAPVLVIGSPFLWWMRVAELRALLAPVVAGTGPSANPDIAAARRFVRGLDAAVAVAAGRPALAFVGGVARLLLHSCRDHAARMERGVAAAASERAQGVDYGLRIVAQEQVGLAYAGWDRLLNRVALPAWRMGRWPSRLDAGVVSALTELSRRDRLAEGFTSRLGERPACDLLEEPGAIDEAASLLAARLFHGGPAESGPGWSPVAWSQYPEEVVDRKWRLEAARLHRVLDDIPASPLAPAPALAEAVPEGVPDGGVPAGPPGGAAPAVVPTAPGAAPTVARVLERLTGPAAPGVAEELEARLTAEVAREAVRERPEADRSAFGAAADAWVDGLAPLFPLQPPRSGRELLTDHVTAMVCCAAVDTAGAAPGLDWLDGPALLVGGARRADLARTVLSLIEDGDGEPLRAWLGEIGVRPEKPVRLA
ncbi:membrane protein [Streptomyces eurocidicus]|uniref:Membrane protein n=1 Tax=Streptomyces eurocidicus TaxID=66423 RepID=A0A2N8NZ27_STREU|nr:membrane protein [Streptomyces eurocidicus]